MSDIFAGGHASISTSTPNIYPIDTIEVYMNNIIPWVTENFASIVAVAGAVVILARVIVKLTPTPTDDSVLEKIVAFLKTVGLHIDDKK